MTDDYVPPEARSARANRPAGRDETIPVDAPVAAALDSLLTAMVEADEVYVVGVLPWECSQRLIEMQAARHGPRRAKTVHYIVPERGAKAPGATMGPSIQRWVAGLFGVRNWVAPHRDDAANPDTLKLHHYEDDPGGRVVLTRRSDRYQAATLLYLPLAQTPSGGSLAAAWFSEEETARIRDHVLGELLPNTRNWEIRQVRCLGPQYMDNGDPDNFQPRLLGLTSRRTIRPDETEPAVVVAVRGRTADGPILLLKRRHRSNSIDDFDVLSLVSEHVIVEDLGSWLKRLQEPLDPRDREAREQLWKAVGRPKEIILEEQFFAEAAQREMFLSCGLNIDVDRLEFRGYRLIKREEGGHLGFAVYRLDLIQQDDLDELDIAVKWSPEDMVPVPLDTLYDGTRSLNRLLRLQRDWLMQNVFTGAGKR